MSHAVATTPVLTLTKSTRAPSLPRKDIYGAVHKGLRWTFIRALVQLGQTDFADEASARRAAAEVLRILAICTLHLAHENDYIHEAIERRRPGAAARIGQAHDEHLASIAELRSYADEVQRAPAEARTAVGRRLYLRFSAFIGENLIHMVEEEELAQALLEEIYTVDELTQIHQALLASIDPPDMLVFLRFMMAGAAQRERTNMLSAALGSFSLDECATLVASLRSEIEEKDWQELTTRVVRSA